MRPLLIGFDEEEEVLRLSLAGAQNKLPVLVDDARLGITRGKPPSSHVVKKPDLELPELVVNEAYCLALARESGLDAAAATPLAPDGQEGLLVERYDRWRPDSEAEVHRIHQEDFCQALGFLPEQKYEGETGPGGRRVRGPAARTGRRTGPRSPRLPGRSALQPLDPQLGRPLEELLAAARRQRRARLAPLYDLLSADVYGGRYGRKMAMKYGGEYRPRYIRGRHLERLAGDLDDLGDGGALRVDDLAERTVAAEMQPGCSYRRNGGERPLLDEICHDGRRFG